jgi:chemotaxis protein methyltransferase CheR
LKYLNKEMNLNTTELKNIWIEVENQTGIDYSQYAFSFMKRRTEIFMEKNQLFSDKEFIYRISTSKVMANSFKEEVFIPGMELFRDPEMWNYFTGTILPSFKNNDEIKIALPYITGPEELYSLLYTIGNHEKKLNVVIYVSITSERIKTAIEKGLFDEKQFNASVKNIELLNYARNSEDIFKRKDNVYQVKHNFKGSINYDAFSLFEYPYIDEFDIVICRNAMIFLNKELQAKAFKLIIKSIKKGKWLILGEKEKLDELHSNHFKQVQKALSIYKRKSFI